MASFTDDFDRANDDIGANWLVDAGQFFIVANKVEPQTADISNRTRYVTALDGADHYAQAIIGGRNTIDCGGVTVRQESAIPTYYVAKYNREYQEVIGYLITKVINGVETDIATAPSDFGSHTVRLEVEGAAQRLYVDGGGIPVATAADSAITAGQYVGLEAYSNAGGRWDDWAAADLAALVPNDAKIRVVFT